MIDRTREDMNQDERLARIEKKIMYLEKLLDAMDSNLTELRPIIVMVERVENFIKRIMEKFNV